MSKIQWCDITWNVAWGCGYGCNFCYARKIAYRFAGEMAKKESYFLAQAIYTENNLKSIQFFEKRFEKFQFTILSSQLNKKFRKKPAIIFANSMFDVADLVDSPAFSQFIAVIKDHPQHDFVVLTKRPHKLLDIYWPRNVLVGISVTNQRDYDRLAYTLRNIQAARKIVCAEPISGEIILNPDYKVNWVICGGESGTQLVFDFEPLADNVRSLQAQCAEIGIPFFFKSWGAKVPEGQEKGKIDGVIYNEFFKK